MLADDSTVRAVLSFFVNEIFVKAAFVAFDIKRFAKDFNERRNNHRLGRYVSMKAITTRGAFDDLFFGLFAFVKVWVYIFNLI